MFPSVPPRAYGWLLALQPALSTPSAGLDDDAALADGASDQCLLITDAYGRLMQLVLALTALVVMYIKRKLETPMRPLKVWALDVGKQCCGAFLVHCLSILFSILFVAEAARGDDECGLYFVSYMLDTTCGVVVLLCLLQLQQALAEKLAWRDLVESGFYGDPPRLAVWAKQVAAYALAVLVMKLLLSAIILWYYDSIAAFATALFSSFTEHRHLELLLVMIIIPGCCNSFQFWIVDSYLKCDGSHWKYFAPFVTSDDEQQQPLTKPTASSLDEQHETTNLLTESMPPLLPIGATGAVKHVLSYDTACETTPLTDSKAAAMRPGTLL